MASNVDIGANATVKVSVSDIACYGLPKVGLFKHLGDFYLRITLDDQTEETFTAKETSNPMWGDTFSFPVVDKGLMIVHIYAKKTFPHRSDRLISEMKSPLDILSILDGRDSHSDTIKQELYKRRKKGKRGPKRGSIQFRLDLSKTDPGNSQPEDTAGSEDDFKKAKDAIANAKEDTRHIFGPKAVIEAAGGVIDATSEGVEDATAIYELWEPLFGKVSIFLDIVEEIADIYPYAKIACAVLSYPLKAMIKQSKLDRDIKALLEQMIDIYQYISSAEQHDKIKAHSTVVQRMCQQTTECAIFIKEYALHGFAHRTLTSPLKDYGSKIAAYQATFAKLRERFMDENVLLTEITVFQISSKTDDILSELKGISIQQELDRLPRASHQRQHGGCELGTRKDVISDIIEWFAQPVDGDAKRFFWLHGVAGSGKSSIAQSVSEQLLSQRRCVSFFFNASGQSGSGLERLYSTISRDLARLNKDWEASLVKAIKNSLKAPEELPLETQLETLVLQPAGEVDNIGPILIIIDALDESGSPEQRSALLKTLSRLQKLPIQFRFLITSRPEKDITTSFKKLTGLVTSDLDRFRKKSTNDDIYRFVRSQLREIFEAEEKSIDDLDEPARQIALRSDGLFQWGSTVCKYIGGNGTSGCDPAERLEEVLTSSHYNGLDGLYMGILSILCTFEPGDKISHLYQTVMGRVLSVREPLSLSALSQLWFDKKDQEKVKSILSPLGSLLRGVTAPNNDEPIQVLHASFSDFLGDEARSKKYWIDTDRQQAMLLHASLREMRRLLKFNICGLGSSYVFNRDVEDLGSRVRECVSPHLTYACCFWVEHLNGISPTQKLEWCGRIYEFIKTRLLFWMEALSLLGRVDRILVQLSMLKDWLALVDDHQDLKQFVSDSYRFVNGFASVLRQSTPHLYLSALGFIPRSSPLSETYLLAFPGSIDVEENNVIRWPQILLNIETSSKIWSIASSPDQKRIVSASEDGTWSIWNAETGDRVLGPIRGHTSDVRSTVFSPDGKYIVSGSKDCSIKVWDAETGEIIADPLNNHTGTVTSLAFSPDRESIASGSHDKTVKIWNWKTCKCTVTLAGNHDQGIYWISFLPSGREIASASYDHKIIIWDLEAGGIQRVTFHGPNNASAFALSPDGRQLVSGAYDGIIRLWNVETGELVLDPFVGHDDEIFSVTFSPDGHYVASCSRDNTVRVWNAQTGQLLAGPFLGHGNAICSLFFSSDGSRITSGSADGTIKIWDVDTGKNMPNFSNAHTQAVRSVVYSPDGERFATGSWDHTLQLRDSATSVLVCEPFRGHTNNVTSVAFSPSGQRFVSGSADNSIRIWDVQTGRHMVGYSHYHISAIHCIAPSPDGRRIVTSSSDEIMKIWDIGTVKVLAESSVGLYGDILSVAFSPDGSRIVSGSSQMTLMMWDPETAQPVSEPFVGHTAKINAVVFSPDGRAVISASDDKTIRIWDVDTGRLIMVPFEGHTDAVHCLAISPNGSHVASGSEDTTLKVWDLTTGKYLASLDGNGGAVYSVAFSPDGIRIASGSQDGLLRIWDGTTRDYSVELCRGHNGPISSVAFSLDGRRIVSSSADKQILVWDTQTNNAVLTMAGHEKAICSAIFSGNEQYIISGSLDGSLKTWYAETGKLFAETIPETTHLDKIYSVAFSPDGMRIASVSSDKSIRIWDSETGRLVARPFLGHTRAITSVEFSLDSESIASGSDDMTVKIWDVKTGKIKDDVSMAGNGDIDCLAFSPDGRYLIVGSGNNNRNLMLLVWDSKTQKVTKPEAGYFYGHTGWVWSVAFSSDGKRMISSSKDKTVRIWDVETTTCIAGPFRGHDDFVFSAALSPDGTQFISGSRDSSVRIWQLNLEEDEANSGSDAAITTIVHNSPKRHPDLDLYTDSSVLEDGWMYGPNRELLFWIPPDYRSAIWRPSNTAIINRNVIRLDLSHFTHGLEWAKCFDESKLPVLSADSE